MWQVMAGMMERAFCHERPCSSGMVPNGAGDSSDAPAYCLFPGADVRDSLLERCRLQASGLDYFSIFAAPATGPRGFCTMGFDADLGRRASTGSLTGVKWLLGASTGALRFSALLAGTCCHAADDGPRPASPTESLRDGFLQMLYKAGDTPAVLTPMMEDLRHKVAPQALLGRMASHPQLRLAVMVTSLHAPYTRLPDTLLRAALLACAAGNVLHPGVLRLLLRRLCFYTGPEPPPLEDDPSAPGGPIAYVPLTAANFHDVLRATTCIPFVSEHCTHIRGVGAGLFFDGALSDYYLNARPRPGHALLLLGDSPAVRRTAFDLCAPWRHAGPGLLARCCVLHPNAAFVAALPAGRLPDTWDWFDKQYIAQPLLRRAHWRAAYELSLRCWPACVGQLGPCTGGWALPAAPPGAPCSSSGSGSGACAAGVGDGATTEPHAVGWDVMAMVGAAAGVPAGKPCLASSDGGNKQQHSSSKRAAAATVACCSAPPHARSCGCDRCLLLLLQPQSPNRGRRGSGGAAGAGGGGGGHAAAAPCAVRVA